MGPQLSPGRPLCESGDLQLSWSLLVPRAGPGGRSEVLARGMNETSGGHHVSGEDKHNDSGDCTQRVCQGTLADSTPGGPRGLWRVRVI